MPSLGSLLAGDSPDSRRFLRGIVIGALVGAMLAGSSRFWRRAGGEPPPR